MKQELAKSYQPKDFEDRIYHMWNDSSSFTPQVDSKKEPYTGHVNKFLVPQEKNYSVISNCYNEILNCVLFINII